MNYICQSCQSMYPDMCNDCLEVINMIFEEEEEQTHYQAMDGKIEAMEGKLFIGSGEDCFV